MSRQGIMLCYPFEESRFIKWGGQAIFQPKLDGDRCRALIDSNGKARLLSSEANDIVSVPHINEALEALHLRNVELDGELYVHGAPHEDIHSIVSREVNMHSQSKLMELHLFDVVNEQTQGERLLTLQNLIPVNRFIWPVPFRVISDMEDVMRYLDNIKERGYEGFVARHLFAPYVRKRSTMMMKFKPKKKDWYTIAGYSPMVDKYGSIKEGLLGRLICCSDGVMPYLGEVPPLTAPSDGYFAVGSGSLLTMSERARLWQMRLSLEGNIAEVEYQHLTSKNHVPRFPVIVSITNLKDKEAK